MAMGWHVTGQRQQDRLTEQGVFEPVWIITYTTDPEGITGSVTVAARFYEPEYVASEIENQVAKNKAVHAL